MLHAFFPFPLCLEDHALVLNVDIKAQNSRNQRFSSGGWIDTNCL